MQRSPQKQAPRRAPARTAPRRNALGPSSRRSNRNPWLFMLLGLFVIALVAGGAFFLLNRSSQGESAGVAGGPTADLLAAAATATPSPTATLPVVSSGSVPGGGEAPAVATAVPAMPAPGAATGAPTALLEATQPPATPDATVPPLAAAPTAATGAVATSAPTTNANMGSSADGAPDLDAVAQRMLELVNADRAANGLQPVAWDNIAALAGQTHSEEMAEFGYMSHWNMDGYGPDYRYSRAGGLDIAQENVYRLVHQWQDGRGAPIDDWEKVVADAQAALMNSPGHRANILAPEHTHLGVGIAYNAATGNVAIAQEFVNRYVTVEPLPKRAQPGDRLVLRGALLPGSADPLVNIAYQPFPQPMTLEALNQTSTYRSPAEHLAVPPVKADADGRFVAEFTLDQDAAPGLYHVWLWVRADGLAEPVQAVNAIIEVSG